MKRDKISFVVLLAAVGLASCGGGETSDASGVPKCVPGSSQGCVCSSGRSGAQTCQSDGVFGPCECVNGASGAGGTADDGGAASGGSKPDAGAGGDADAGTEPLQPAWSRAFGPGVSVIALDSDTMGNVMIMGRLEQSVDFGNGPIGPTGSGNDALFVASFDATGHRRFAYSLTASRLYWDDAAYTAHMDEAGNVVVTGVAFRKVGDSSVSYPCGSQSSTGEWVSFAARLDNTGECVWVKTKLGDARFAATVDDDGSTYLTGVDSAASFTSKLDANGDELWRAEGTGGDSIEVDANGNVFFARSDGIYYPDLCVVSLDGSGAERWNQCYGQLWKGDSYARFRGLSVNAAGAFALAGQYGDSLSFGGPALSAGGESAMFLAALDVDNQHMFSKSIPEITSDSGGNNPAPVIPAISADGKVALAGGFWRSIDFGAGQQQAIGTGDDDTDAFVAVYGSTGELVAHAQYGGDSSDWVRSAHYDATGALLIAGPFSSAIDFGEGPLEATGSDGDPRTAWLFVARLLP